jgi:hypothetical protein
MYTPGRGIILSTPDGSIRGAAMNFTANGGRPTEATVPAGAVIRPVGAVPPAPAAAVTAAAGNDRYDAYRGIFAPRSCAIRSAFS